MSAPLASEPQPVPSPPPTYVQSSPVEQDQSTPRTIPGRTFSIARKPVPKPPQESKAEPIIQNSPCAPVRIDDGADLPQASSAQIENFHNSPTTPQLELPQFEGMSIEDPAQPRQISNPAFPPRRDSMQPLHFAQSQQYNHTPASSGSWSMVDSQLKDGGNANIKKSRISVEQDGQSHNSSSRGSLESMAHTSDSYEPLAYHHQQLQSPQQAARASKVGMHLTESPVGSTNNLAVRRSRGPRPLSTYSSASDLAGGSHRRNLSASPYLQGRSSSRNSTASPDHRSLSVHDLLNTSYPQPGPTQTSFDNSYLRSSVGNNASLLSHRQTFEMYLANVTKTDAPAVQYEFAVFMINSMREMPNVDLEDSASITRQRLMRESKSILQRLADRSYPFAQYYLADGYASGLFNKGKEDYDRAFPMFVAASKHGHVEACYRTALCYEFGWGCRVDGGRAVQFYRQAASKNHPGAMLRMAKACLAGDMGLGKRYREGIKWMKRAAESSDEQYNAAPYELGLLHETGYGDDVFPDPSYAAQLFTKSAELGHVEAAYRLGDAYEHGKLDCPRDPALSIHFYTTAAQAGHPLAMMALCAWYLVGSEPVLEKDENEAYEWALRAAKIGMSTRRHGRPISNFLIAGLAKAQYAVGYFTEMGIGCHRDPLEANVWYVKAADQGDERARHRIAVIRSAADGTNPAMARGGRRLGKSDGNGQG